jgi:ribosomal protein S18 acetylase RimI-like enzyme
MVVGVRNPSATTTDPHVRQIDPWRDGRAIANLLETAFNAEIDPNGERLIHSLRNYGVMEALSYGFGTGFVWVEDGAVVANASIQRNFFRHNTWIIGNVATHTAFRNRGIGRAVVEACIRHAAAHGAHYVALQVDVTNPPALHLYEKIGFDHLGEVTHFVRPPVRVEPIATQTDAGVRSDSTGVVLRKAGWSDRSAIWDLRRLSIPDEFTFAEPFDGHTYRLGLRWSFVNALNGNPEQWWVAERANKYIIGAARTRINYDAPHHQIELLLGPEATAQQALALLEQGLWRFDRYLSKPISAAQARPHDTVRTAFRAAGFQPTRTLAHMRLEVRS